MELPETISASLKFVVLQITGFLRQSLGSNPIHPSHQGPDEMTEEVPSSARAQDLYTSG